MEHLGQTDSRQPGSTYTEFLAIWLWAIDLTSLSLSVLIWRMGVTRLPVSKGCCKSRWPTDATSRVQGTQKHQLGAPLLIPHRKPEKGVTHGLWSLGKVSWRWRETSWSLEDRGQFSTKQHPRPCPGSRETQEVSCQVLIYNKKPYRRPSRFIDMFASH